MRQKFSFIRSQFNLGCLWQSNRAVLLLSLIFGAGILLRVYALGSESLWLDEAISVRYSSGSLSSILADPMARNNPPLYWILLHFWIGLFGTGEAALRAMSVVFGGLSIPVIYLLGKELFSQRVGLIVSALSAVSYFYIYYSQEARPYALFLFLSLLSYLFFVKILKHDKNWYYPCYFVVNLLLAYTHVYSLFVIASEIFYFLLFWTTYRQQRKRFLATLLSTLLGMLPLLVLLELKAVRVMERGLWITQPGLRRLFDTFAMYAGTGASRYALYLIFFALALLGLLSIRQMSGKWRWRRILESLGQSRWEIKLWRVDVSIMLVIWLSFPILIPFLASQVITPFYIIRYTIGASPAFYLLVANGIGSIKREQLLYPLLAIIIILSGFGIYRYYALDVKEQWREVANLIESQSAEGDAIIICASCCQTPFDYYYQGALPRSSISKDADGEEVAAFTARVTAGKNRLWLVLSHGGKYGLIGDYLRSEHDSTPAEYKFVGVQVFLFDLAPFPEELPGAR